MFSFPRLNGVTILITPKVGSSYLEDLKSSMPKTRGARNLTWFLMLLKKGKSRKILESPKTVLIAVVEILMNQLRKLDAGEV